MGRRRRRAPTLGKICALALACVLTGAGAFLFLGASDGNGRNIANVVFPRPYSDTHIPESARIADARFRDSVTIESGGSVANVLTVLRGLRTAHPALTPAGTTPERGTWLWTPVLDITPAYRDSIIAGAKRNGITAIYLSIDSYLDIYTLPEGAEKDARTKEFTRILADFIEHASREGIVVDAEAGWRNWAEVGHQYKAFAVIEYAKGFNATHEEKFRGFQYDVEPYLLEEYSRDKKAVLKRFTALIEETLEWLEDSDLRFSAAIPDFYDTSWGSGKFFYGLLRDDTYTHLLRLLERREGSTIIVMAYRNFAEGKDGSIAIAKGEVREASRRGTRVIVAQEVGDVPPPFITFHGTSRAHYSEQTALIESAFADERGFGGLATHYINALLALR